MKGVLLNAIAVLALLTGIAMAQSGPINVVTVDPRENADLANTTGTETGQPSDLVPRSYNSSNGLTPVTGNISGNGSTVNLHQPAAESKPTQEESSAARQPTGHSQKTTHQVPRK